MDNIKDRINEQRERCIIVLLESCIDDVKILFKYEVSPDSPPQG